MTHNQSRGARIMSANKRRSKALENDIRTQCDMLRGLRLADVVKIPDPVDIERRYKDDHGRVKVEGRLAFRTTVDFMGLVRGGMAVRFDAKTTTNSTRFDFSMLDNKKDGSASTARTQREILAHAAALGGLAFVYVRHQPDEHRAGRDYILPVDKHGVVAGISHKKSLNFASDGARFMMGRDQTWFDKLRELLSSPAPASEAPPEADGIEDLEAEEVSSPAPNVRECNDSSPVRRLSTT